MSSITVTPFLLFQQGNGSAALALYKSVFPDFRIEEMQLYGTEGPGTEGTIKRGLFSIGGQPVRCTDSVVSHAFSFTPSFSFFIECHSEEELRSLSAALKDGGAELMPVASYGFSKLFTWVNDRFGVSWQLNYA